MHSTNVVVVRLPGGRLLIASLDPNTPAKHSPLRQALRTTPNPQASNPQEEQGEGQPGQTRIRTPR